MSILNRNLLSETVEDLTNTTIYLTSNCTSTKLINCYSSNNHCICTSTPSPNSPPSQPHLVKYVVSSICALGVAFLILSTCTILLRQRWGRIRRWRRSDTDSRGSVLVESNIVDHPIWHITTVGLPQSVIDEITSFKYRKLDSGGMLNDGKITSDCSVCLTEFEDGDDLRLLPKCCHAFHLQCIDIWLLSHTNCPLCRAPIVNESPNSTSMLSSRLSESGIGSSELSQVDGGSVIIDGTGDGGGGESSDVNGKEFFTELRMEIVKSNRENTRVLSDLGTNYRVTGGDAVGEIQVQQSGGVVGRRSASMDVSSSAASAMSSGGSSEFMVEVVVVSEESSSSSSSSSSKQDKDIITTQSDYADDAEKTGSGSASRKSWLGSGRSMSSLMKSSSIERSDSLQKPAPAPAPAPTAAVISMDRTSFSSSGRMFTFLGSKRHASASVLPL